ncbi:MAG: beta-propeller domain-containing protein, partial [Clostridia bacterium]|nr:beta-propeller domain-containing protein [Clostridia bacterium]
ENAESIIEGYSGYISSAKLEELNIGTDDKTVSSITPKESDGIATYGDFKADIIKTDGEYLYIASTGINAETGDFVEQIKIVKASVGGSMESVSVITLSESTPEGLFDKCIELYLKDNKLTAIMNRHENTFADAGVVYDNSSVIAVYYDIADPYAPVKIREHAQDGEYVSSSLYGNKLCLVTAKSISDSLYDKSEDFVPSFSINGEKVNLKVEDIQVAVNDPEDSYLFITVTDITDFTKGVGRFALLGCDNKIYCTPSAVVAVREFSSEEEDENGNRSTFTEVHRINIDCSAAKYSGWYRLQGSLVGEISVDEESGNLRALTTDGSANRLYVLDESLKFIIALDIFNGEKVTRVSFVGNNCYVMVEDGDGEKTVIIDFSDPSSPEVAGKISEKAFSDKLYEVSDTMILGIGDSRFEVVAEENGEKRVLMPMSMTLFDVSDPANPESVSVYTFDKSIRSVAATDSRSVMVDSEKKIFGIPVLEIDSERSQRSAYVIFDVSDGTIVPIGTYTHSRIGDAAVRSVCIGDILYTVSGDKIVAFDMSADASEKNKLTEFPLN